ncbi:hypothetical protein VTO42DRAFT_5340 [Malbranchea cinnamomea]
MRQPSELSFLNTVSHGLLTKGDRNHKRHGKSSKRPHGLSATYGHFKHCRACNNNNKRVPISLKRSHTIGPIRGALGLKMRQDAYCVHSTPYLGSILKRDPLNEVSGGPMILLNLGSHESLAFRLHSAGSPLVICCVGELLFLPWAPFKCSVMYPMAALVHLS